MTATALDRNDSSTRRVRIAAAALALAFAAAVGIGLHAWSERRMLIEQATRDVERIVEVLRVDADRTYRAAMAAVQAVDSHISLNDHPRAREEAHAASMTMQATLGADFSVRLIGPDGLAQDWPPGTLAGPVSLADRDYVAAILGGHAGWFVGRPGVSRITGARFLPVARKASANAHGVAVVSAAITLDRTLNLYEGIRPGPNAAVGLFRTDGTLLVRAPFDEGMLGRRYSGPLFEALARSPNGLFDAVVQTDGLRRITAYRSLDGLPLVVAVGFAVQDVLRTWYRLLAVYVGAFVIFAGLVALFAVHIDRAAGREAGYIADLVRSRDRAEEANAAKSRFLANMSHELRTPLNAIMGFSEIIRDRIFGADIDRYAAYAGDIHRSAGHLLALVNDILDLARVESGKLELRFEMLNLQALVADALAVAAPVAAERHIRLESDVPAGLVISADRRAMRQMLLNLLANAIRYGPANARVAVGARIGADIALYVRDAGGGVPVEVRQQLDRPLDSGRDPLVSGAGGAGLGLPIVQALARAHGGRLEFAAGPAGGEVGIVLPRQSLRQVA